MHVAKLSEYVRGAITATSIVEGLAVKITNSGTVNGYASDLPIVALATSGQVEGVYVIEAAPDNFPRPVDSRQYTAGWTKTFDSFSSSGYADPVETVTLYKVGISNLDNPTIPSGFLVRLHKGTTVTLAAASWVDSANIKVPGNLVEVGADGKWQYTASASSAVGFTEEYADGKLTIRVY